MVADHLSRLVPESISHGLPIGDSFPDEQLFFSCSLPMVCGHSKLCSDRTNSTPMDLSTKEEIFGGH